MTILHSYEEYSGNGFTSLVCSILVILTIMSVIIFVVSIAEADWIWAIGSSVFAAIFALGAGIFFNIASIKHTEYEVIIHDYNEVYEQGYEIVEERGDITVVKRIKESSE